ncbi:MAG: hypothetical protein ACT4QD_25100 [Acidobacteriota bacterium]
MRSDDFTLDPGPLAPTTAHDIAVLRQLRAEAPSWFSLTASELDALLPADALDRRPATPPTARPFVLP